MLGALFGFLGPWIPEAIGFFRDRADRQHELAMYELRLQHADADADRAAWADVRVAESHDRSSARLYQPDATNRIITAASKAKLPKWMLGFLVTAFGLSDWAAQMVRVLVTYGVLAIWSVLLLRSLRNVLDGGNFLWANEWEVMLTVLGAFAFDEIVLAVVFFWFGARERRKWKAGR